MGRCVAKHAWIFDGRTIPENCGRNVTRCASAAISSTGELIQRDRLAACHRDPGITQPRFEPVGIATRRIQPEAETPAAVRGDAGQDRR